MATGMASPPSSCTIPYPDRFYEASKYVDSLPENAFTSETRLLLYALQQQANVGPCKDSKPWGWNMVEAAKWQSWTQLGTMSTMEAMRLYVRTLDEEKPEWWLHISEGSGSDAGGAASSAVSGAVGLRSAIEAGCWVVITQDDGKKPLPRYEQGTSLVGSKLFVLGGHYGGRYLSDAWVYDLGRLQWSPVTPTAAPPPPLAGEVDAQASEVDTAPEEVPLLPPGLAPVAGQSVTPWQGQLLLVGGHVKGKDAARLPIPVRLLDPESLVVTDVVASGDAPCARGGHVACLSGSTLYVYGGEDSSRRPLADLYTLDLDTLTWSRLAYEGRPRDMPPARSGAAATVYQSRYLLVFGGGSIGACLGDTWVLDLESRTWSRPTLHGEKPAPRAGHSGALVGDTWYIIGGGNNIKGCTDMLAADLTELPAGSLTWSRVCSVPIGSPLSSEGIGVNYAADLGLLVAFGGYNGKYHNAVSIYKLPSAGDEVTVRPEGIIRKASVSCAHPQPPKDAAPAAAAAAPPPPPPPAPEAPTPSSGSGSGPQANGGPPLTHEQALLKELAVAREQLKKEVLRAREEAELAQAEAAAARKGAAAQTAALQQQVEAAQAALAQAQQASEEARAALSAEQARTLQLEAQLAELNEQLAAAAELEKEVEKYRAAESEKKSGGLWGMITGQ